MALNLPGGVLDALRIIAPTLLTALGGPMGAVAAAVASSALDAWLGPVDRKAIGGDLTKATPAAITQAVQANMSDPAFVLALKQADLDLQRYEADAKFRFADIEQRDRGEARGMARETGLARPQFVAGMGIVCLSLLLLFAIVAGCIMALNGTLRVDPANASLTVAAFGLLGTVVGVFQAVSAQILAFYFGSSAGSSEKTAQMTDTMRDMGQALGDAAKSAPPLALPAPPPVVVVPPAPDAPVTWEQSPFGGVRWRLDEGGYVLVQGEDRPGRTVGEPVTVRRIWRDYGPLIQRHSAVHGVPLEIVVACIATESRGQVAASLTEPDGRRSLGLMQVLTSTASEVMGRAVAPDELLAPDVGIEAGVRYMARQRPQTGYSPPKAAAAYNAGGLYEPRSQDSNRWRLRSTGDHIDRFCLYFNDAVFVAKADNWSH